MYKDRSRINKKCSKCGWKTYSFISYDYVYCPKCGSPLEEYVMNI